MEKDTQSRKWQLTINNPVQYGLHRDAVRELLAGMKSVAYWCASDEIGENNTYHTHIFLYGRSGIRFSTIKKNFPPAHMEMARGTCQQNMEYVSKTGKWEKDKKHETCVPDTFEEWGEMPVERQGKRSDYDDLYDMIKSGMSDNDILEQGAEYMACLDMIGRTRQIVKQKSFEDVFRQLDIVYIWGDTGTGKTRGVMEKHGYANVYRVTDYLHPFDGYSGQDVILFDEFRSDLPLKDMLKYLDGYPLELPCRYMNKYACFTKVYIVSNIPIVSQYPQIYRESYESWLAFLRRINRIMHYTRDKIEEQKCELDDHSFRLVFEGEVPNQLLR